MRKLVLALCLSLVVVPFAAAQHGRNQNGQNGGQNGQKRHGHAPEMPGPAMAVAGIIALGGYLLLRRRFTLQN